MRVFVCTLYDGKLMSILVSTNIYICYPVIHECTFQRMSMCTGDTEYTLYTLCACVSCVSVCVCVCVCVWVGEESARVSALCARVCVLRTCVRYARVCALCAHVCVCVCICVCVGRRLGWGDFFVYMCCVCMCMRGCFIFCVNLCVCVCM